MDIKVKSAQIGKLNKDKTGFENSETIECDCICVSGFWTPTVHLASQSGNKLKFNDQIDAFVPDKSKQNETSIGASKGTFTLKETLEEGLKTGFEVSKNITNKNNLSPTLIQMNPRKIHMINFGALLYQKEKILSVLWTFKMMLQFQI